jgi:hypothetical protein
MPRRHASLKDRRRHDRNPAHLYEIPTQGMNTAGQPLLEALVEQGHYRCSCCRRPDSAETSAVAARPRGNRHAMLALK